MFGTQIAPSIVKPTMLLDADRARRNILLMAKKASSSGVRFRPHFKTHQSARIGEWFRDVGVTCITVSSVDMATYFADHGWTDITIAFPVNLREIEKINRLAARVRLHLLVESVGTVRFLAQQLTAPVAIWIEVDTGYRRSGVRWDDPAALCAVASEIAGCDKLSLHGLLLHDGQTYGARSVDEIIAIHHATTTRMEQVRLSLTERGFGGLELSIGDTPACSVLSQIEDVDEIRPGNFVFYDLMQIRIGSCTADDVAVAVACPVVAKYPERRELILYGGAVHLSKDYLRQPSGDANFGQIALLQDTGWGMPLEGAWLRSLSQEHGIVHGEPGLFESVLDRVQVGDLLAVIPVHSCLTADLLKRYLTLDGEWIDMAPIA